MLLGLLCFTGCSRGPETKAHTVFARGTPVTVTIPASFDDVQQQIISSTASNLIERIYNKLSLRVEDSETSSINRIAHTIRLPISRDTYSLLQLCRHFTELTGGAFDITITPIAYLWGFHGGEVPERPLSSEVLQAALKGVGQDKIVLSRNAVELASPYTRVDFGRIIEAYAIDLSVIKLRRMDYTDFCLSAEGLSRCLGTRAGGTPWQYPVTDPFSGQRVGALMLSELPAAATLKTGDNTVSIGGKAYSHVIDPRTGQPAERFECVTVLAPTATKAVALARALFVLDLDEGREVLQNFPRCEALYIPAARPAQYIMTRGMAGFFSAAPDAAPAIQVLDY